jgi:hypothetical protein
MKKYIIMNILSGAVEIVIAKSHWKAMTKAKAFFGSNSKVKVWEDRLSSQLS